MSELELHTRATNIANSYLIELLLGQLVNQQPSPVAAIDALRFYLQSQMQDDFARGLHTDTRGNADALRASVAQVLEEVFDRAASQYEIAAKPLGSA
ncbi:MAG: hypothetical protein ACYC1F_05170 [Gallionellaceae bacterium]